MTNYSHITIDNTPFALCGAVTDNIYFLFWQKATCPQCRQFAIDHASQMGHFAGEPPLTPDEVREAFGLVDPNDLTKEPGAL